MPEYEVYARGGRGGHIGVDWGSAVATYMGTPVQKQYKYIKDYNYIPSQFNFHKVNNEEELFLGVELEIDKGGKKDENAKLVIDTLGERNVYCKHDGSLSDQGEGGFEIVTHPCTYEYHQRLSYEILFEQLTKLGYRSHDIHTCGLHIHINRNYFGKDKLIQDLNISKLLYLFEKYWDNVVLIARRNTNHYARRFYLEEDESILDLYTKSKNGDKYGVINLKHRDTVEIRIFKGTLNYRTFMATLQFVNKITKIIKQIDIYHIQELMWEDIVKSFDDELIGYIEERKEAKSKEKQKEVKNAMSAMGYSNSYIPSTVIIDTPNIYQREYTSSWVFNYPVQEVINIEDMTIEQLKNRINDIKRQINRSRNPMEIRELQREMSKYTNRLGHLRRINQNRRNN